MRAACDRFTVWPAMLAVPVRALDSVLSRAVTVTVPLPEPLAGSTDAQEALLEAAQPQPLGAVTLTDDTPPSALNEMLVVLKVYVQLTPACTMVYVCPATVTVPVRLDVPVFAWTENAAVPLPDPLPEVTVIQAALLVADQEHPLGAVTAVLAEPPAAATDADVELRV